MLGRAPDFRPGVVLNYLQNGIADLLTDTFYKEITAVPAAHQLRVADGKLRIEPYWRLEASERFRGDPIAAFRDLFIDSVRLRTRSDVPLGTCLSGGLDSGAIVCSLPLVMGEASTQVTRKTFTANYREYDEQVYVDLVNGRSGSTGYTITPEPPSLASLEEMLWFHDEPFHSFTAWAGYEVMWLAPAKASSSCSTAKARTSCWPVTPGRSVTISPISSGGAGSAARSQRPAGRGRWSRPERLGPSWGPSCCSCTSA